MIKALELAKKIKDQLDKNWLPDLIDNDLNDIFKPCYSLNLSIEDCNRVICFIIYAYSPESLWLDLKKDRLENKEKILSNLGADLSSKSFKEIINSKNDIVGDCIFSYLENSKNWKFRAIFDLLEYSAKMFRFANEDTGTEVTHEKMNKEGNPVALTAELDAETIVKINKGKSELQDIAIAKRKKADELLEEIRKEFVNTDNATKNDFGFSFTDTSKKRDILSWRAFIRERNEKKASIKLQ